MRFPYAAKQLLRQAQEQRPKAKMTAQGDPDGLGVHRTIVFDKRTSTYLAPLLDQIKDPRITEHHLTNAGYLHVTFTPTWRGDVKDPFPLADAAVVASVEKGVDTAGEGESGVEGSGVEAAGDS